MRFLKHGTQRIVIESINVDSIAIIDNFIHFEYGHNFISTYKFKVIKDIQNFKTKLINAINNSSQDINIK